MVLELALNALLILLLVKPHCCSEAEHEMLTKSGDCAHGWNITCEGRMQKNWY